MMKLSREDLFSLEEYAERRPEFRAAVLEHKKNRHVAIGPNATLSFDTNMELNLTDTMLKSVMDTVALFSMIEDEKRGEERTD